MVEFARETLFDVIEDVEPLLEQHYRELAKHQDRVKLNPDWHRYRDLEQNGAFLVFTVRRGRELVGYAGFFASRHPHYADLMLVSNDVLFLVPTLRGGTAGVRFIRFCEDQLRAIYAQQQCALTWHAKEGTTLAAVLPRMNYGVQDIVFSKLF